MRVIDPGHEFELASYDGGEPLRLVFMKREGPGYPFNIGHHPGTNCQEILRAFILRTQYLQNQIYCWQNRVSIALARIILWLFEQRAAKRHRRRFSLRLLFAAIELMPTCYQCGHIGCEAHKK